MKLNLGACDRHVNGYKCVDKTPKCQTCGTEDEFVSRGCERILVFSPYADLSRDWPWQDSTIEEILAYDICEHLPSRIDFMNEAWRVMKPGAHLFITTPNAAKGGGFQQDPTHITPWTINSFKYFDHRTPEWRRFCPGNGFVGRFKVIHLIETSYQDGPLAAGCATPDPVFKLDVRLEAVK